MSPSSRYDRGGALTFLAGLFILIYFAVLSHDGLNTYFAFDDGMALLDLHKIFEVSVWKNLRDILQVFTPVFRPIGALYYRTLYGVFGFNPVPFRIVFHLILVFNTYLMYRLARTVKMTRAAAGLTTLFFVYNGSMVDLYYNSSTIYDILCFAFYSSAVIVYARDREHGPPRTATIIKVILLFLLAMDSKEMCVTLPVTLLAYEVFFHWEDYRIRPVLVRSGGLIGAMLLMSLLFAKVKVAAMSPATSAYQTHVSLQFVIDGICRYMNQLLGTETEALGTLKTFGLLGGMFGAGALLRSRQAMFGTVFFAAALLPVALIPQRGGYAAYVAFPGMCLAFGAILDSARTWLLRALKIENLDTSTAVALFLCVAVLWGRHEVIYRKDGMGNLQWDDKRRVDFFQGMSKLVPEFPPDARILVTDDPWGPDWGMFFFTRLMYHDKQLWLDRTHNFDKDKQPDPKTYDILVNYKSCDLAPAPGRFLGIPLKWETLFYIARPGTFTVSSADPNWAQDRNVEFLPAAARAGQPVKFTAPGLSNIVIDVVYRTVTNGKVQKHYFANWCSLDANGSCMVTAPSCGPAGTMVVDWIRPVTSRWIFTTGVLTVVE